MTRGRQSSPPPISTWSFHIIHACFEISLRSQSCDLFYHPCRSCLRTQHGWVSRIISMIFYSYTFLVIVIVACCLLLLACCVAVVAFCCCWSWMLIFCSAFFTSGCLWRRKQFLIGAFAATATQLIDGRIKGERWIIHFSVWNRIYDSKIRWLCTWTLFVWWW